MPRAKKGGENWEAGFRAAIRSLSRGWGVLEHSGKVRLRLQFPKGQGLPSNQQATLPYPWSPESQPAVIQLVSLILEQVNKGEKTLQAALCEVLAKSDVKQKDPRNWEQIVERHRNELINRGNQIKEKTYQASYGRYFEGALKLLRGHGAPRTGSELVNAVLDHQRTNRKAGKVHGTPLKPWRQQASSRQECCLALKKLIEFAVEDCHQPQSWIIGQAEYKRLRGGRPRESPRATLTDEECVQIFTELDKKENRGWGDVARILRIYGVRMWEINFLVVRTNWEGEKQLFVSKGKVYTSQGVKEVTDPRFLEPVPVANEKFNLLKKIDQGELVLPKGDNGKAMEISGANFGANLRKIPIWQILVKTKAAQGEKLVPYSFRHTYSAKCTELGIHTDHASAAMGHSAEVHRRIYRTDTQASVTRDFERARSRIGSATKAVQMY
jgi:integrase